MKIHIGEKYMFILDNKGRDIAHFEHFEVKNVKNPVIDFTIEILGVATLLERIVTK